MIDKSLVTPLYVQVANELREEIISGKYGTHGCIGTHTQLTERYEVSLRTIRKAVQTLEEEGLVEIRQGKGTFVRGTMLVDPLRDLTGISNMLNEMCVEKQISVPVFKLMDVPGWIDRDVAEALGKKCLFIRRIVSIQGTPIADADMYLPEKFYSSMVKEEVEVNTVYQIFHEKLGINLGRGRQFIRATGARGELAESLHLPENSPVLQIERKSYDSQENLIEFMILTYEASKYCFEVEMDLNKPW